MAEYGVDCDSQECFVDDYAEKLIKAGYGDKKQAVKEAFEKLKDRIDRRCVDRGATDIHKLYIEANMLDKIYRAIDYLFIELYGTDENE